MLGALSAVDAAAIAAEAPVLHVLVVDDDAAVRRRAARSRRGWAARWLRRRACTAARAILKHQKIDLLLLDLRLPGGGGLALLEQVKALYPDTAVVVMTAFATVSSAVEAMRIGAGDYLTKPFALEELTTVLERAGQRVHFNVESRRLRERLRTQQGDGRAWWGSLRRWRSCTGFCRRWRSRRIRC